jgi:radical SAM superfamily enzyme YgiQ (UPF0313 family)
MEMKIYLVVPNRKLGYPPLFKKLLNIPNLSISTLASLTPKHYDISVIDENLKKINLCYYDTIKADLVGITVHTPNAERAYSIAKILRKRGISVVLGGIHPSSLPEEALQYCDAVLVGEAENLWIQLLDDFSAGKLKRIYKSSKKPSLVNSKTPRFDLFPNRSLIAINPIQMTRGCPFKCEFCSVSAFYGNTCRYKPVYNLIKEIKNRKSRYVFFVDDNIVSSRRYSFELFSELKSMGIKWFSQVPISFAKDEELLHLAKKSGCSGVMIGFDSVIPESLKSVSKTQNNVDGYLSCVRRIRNAGIPVAGSFIFGFDEDDTTVFERTIEFTKMMEIDVAYFFILTPYPGTKLYRQLTEEGRIIDNDWAKYDCNHVVFLPKKMKPYELIQGFEWAWNEFYSARISFKRMFKKFTPAVVFANSFYLFGRRFHRLEIKRSEAMIFEQDFRYAGGITKWKKLITKNV